MLDKDSAVAVVIGVYTLPPVEKVKGDGEPSIYHEDCFFAILAANALQESLTEVEDVDVHDEQADAKAQAGT